MGEPFPEAEAYRVFRENIGAPVLAETPPAPGELPSEIELQSRWFAGEFGREFQTVDGQEIEIVQFGHWNHSAGPDFSEVVVSIGGQKRAGTLEIDLDIRGWEHHGHSQSSAYDNTVLHLFVKAPGRERFFTKTSQNREVPQVQLDPTRPQTPAARSRDFPEAKLGRCSFPLQNMGAAQINGLLRAAAQFRLSEKARRFHQIEAAHGWGQAVFQMLAEALGYRQNKLPLRVLAQRFPIKFLRARKSEAEALLFGASGFLESPVYEKAAPDTRDYLRELWETWWHHRSASTPGDPLPWVLSRSRPANHPQRRTAALAHVADSWPSFQRTLDPEKPFSPKSILEFFGGLTHPYWSHHYTLTSKRTASPMALVGQTRANDFLTNALYPWRLSTEPDLWISYTALPGSGTDEKSRRAAIRLLGEHPERVSLTKRMFQQQALLQIYDDFCLKDQSDCAGCPFPKQLQTWVSGQPQN